MSDYTRHLAELRGVIEAHDLRAGDVIMVRCPGDIERTSHTVTAVRPEPGRVALTMADGHDLELSPGMPVTLVSLVESAKLTGWQIGGAL